VALKSIQH